MQDFGMLHPNEGVDKQDDDNSHNGPLPEQSEDDKKAKKLVCSINMYLNYQDIKNPNNDYSARFDLILVSGKGEIVHIENIPLMDFII